MLPMMACWSSSVLSSCLRHALSGVAKLRNYPWGDLGADSKGEVGYHVCGPVRDLNLCPGMGEATHRLVGACRPALGMKKANLTQPAAV